MQGIREWTSSLGYKVLEVHYTADPPKRTPEWKAAAQKGMSPEAWEREHEINWTQHGGERLFRDFRRDFHIREVLPPHPKTALLRWWDFGYHWPAVGVGQLTSDGRFIIRDSFRMEDVVFDVFMDEVLRWCWRRFGPVYWHDFCDSAGTHTTHRSALTDVQALAVRGVYASCRRMSEVEGVNLIRGLLRQSRPLSDKGEDFPVFVVSPEAAEYASGFLGGFVEDSKKPDQCKEIHWFIDLLDALRYAVGFVFDPATLRPYERYSRPPAEAFYEEELHSLLQAKSAEITSAIPWGGGR